MKKKMVAPIIITILVVLYLIIYFFLLTSTGISGWLIGILLIIMAGMMIQKCIERIEEIKGGEEDDLSKY